MSQEVNVLPSDGRYPHEQFQGLLVAHCLVAVQYPGEQNGVVGNHDIRNQASALVADRDIQVGVSDQFLSTACGFRGMAISIPN